MRCKKEWEKDVPAPPIAENHGSTRKQGPQGAQISEPSIPSETLTSDPPFDTGFRETEREREREESLRIQRAIYVLK
jgi:hypothetical protein